jgi:hypothetical protein
MKYVLWGILCGGVLTSAVQYWYALSGAYGVMCIVAWILVWALVDVFYMSGSHTGGDDE